MKEETTIKNCMTCGKELKEGRNIKLGWHKPICNDCREVLLNYFMNKDKIERVLRYRFTVEARQKAGV